MDPGSLSPPRPNSFLDLHDPRAPGWHLHQISRQANSFPLHARRFMRRHQRLSSARHACATAIIASEPWKDGRWANKSRKVGSWANFAMASRAYFACALFRLILYCEIRSADRLSQSLTTVILLLTGLRAWLSRRCFRSDRRNLGICYVGWWR